MSSPIKLSLETFYFSLTWVFSSLRSLSLPLPLWFSLSNAHNPEHKISCKLSALQVHTATFKSISVANCTQPFVPRNFEAFFLAMNCFFRVVASYRRLCSTVLRSTVILFLKVILATTARERGGGKKNGRKKEKKTMENTLKFDAFLGQTIRLHQWCV